MSILQDQYTVVIDCTEYVSIRLPCKFWTKKLTNNNMHTTIK